MNYVPPPQKNLSLKVFSFLNSSIFLGDHFFPQKFTPAWKKCVKQVGQESVVCCSLKKGRDGTGTCQWFIIDMLRTRHFRRMNIWFLNYLKNGFQHKAWIASIASILFKNNIYRTVFLSYLDWSYCFRFLLYCLSFSPLPGADLAGLMYS